MPYVYKWTHLPTLNWYVGVRYAKDCHPNDGYICSSKIVRPMIEQNPHEWVRSIIDTGTSSDMKQLEKDILGLSDAKNDPRSYNQTNAGIPYGWLIPWNKGLPKELSHRYGKPGGMVGKSQSNLQKKVTSEMSKIRNKIKSQCPHCQQIGQNVAMKRWHFDNCRMKGGI